MMNLSFETQERLKSLAFERTIPFCYSCYQEAPSGRCSGCLSDDLMRLLPGDGCEYGVDWVIKSLVKENLTPINMNERFEESVRESYPETTQVGWMELDTVQIMKELDPIGWDVAQTDWQSNEESDGQITTFDNSSTYYRSDEVEEYLDREDIRRAEAS